jgi:hypothetical protein
MYRCKNGVFQEVSCYSENYCKQEFEFLNGNAIEELHSETVVRFEGGMIHRVYLKGLAKV